MGCKESNQLVILKRLLKLTFPAVIVLAKAGCTIFMCISGHLHY